jgi:hypothetical protein
MSQRDEWDPLQKQNPLREQVSGVLLTIGAKGFEPSTPTTPKLKTAY